MLYIFSCVCLKFRIGCLYNSALWKVKGPEGRETQKSAYGRVEGCKEGYPGSSFNHIVWIASVSIWILYDKDSNSTVLLELLYESQSMHVDKLAVQKMRLKLHSSDGLHRIRQRRGRGQEQGNGEGDACAKAWARAKSQAGAKAKTRAMGRERVWVHWQDSERAWTTARATARAAARARREQARESKDEGKGRNRTKRKERKRCREQRRRNQAVYRQPGYRHTDLWCTSSSSSSSSRETRVGKVA